MATGKISLDEGTTTNTATNTISEDAVTKHLPRSVLNKSDGTELGTSSTPLEVNVRSSTVGVATSAKQDTGNTSLAAINSDTTATAASASVLDDWDESDRAKVNPIVGQAGVVGGAGTTGATTQRVVLATDTTVPNVTGNVANDGVDSGNPVKIGGYAGTSLPAVVADGDRVNALFSKTGKLVAIGSLREMLGNQQTTITSSTTETTIVTADATYLLDIYGLIITNISTTYTKVTIKDATAGTTRFVFSIPPQETRGFMSPVDSGHKQAVVNNNWTATCGTSVASIEITAMFDKRL